MARAQVEPKHLELVTRELENLALRRRIVVWLNAPFHTRRLQLGCKCALEAFVMQLQAVWPMAPNTPPLEATRCDPQPAQDCIVFDVERSCV